MSQISIHSSHDIHDHILEMNNLCTDYWSSPPDPEVMRNVVLENRKSAFETYQQWYCKEIVPLYNSESEQTEELDSDEDEIQIPRVLSRFDDGCFSQLTFEIFSKICFGFDIDHGHMLCYNKDNPILWDSCSP